MVGAVLGVILGEEDRGVLPDGGVGDSFDELTDGLVVVGDIGLRGRGTNLGGLGVVIAQPDELDRRNGAVLHLLVEVGLPLVDAGLRTAVLGHRLEGVCRVRAGEGPADVVMVGVRVEHLLVGRVSFSVLVTLGVEAVVAEADVVLRQVLPEVGVMLLGAGLRVIVFAGVRCAASGVVGRSHLLRPRVRVGLGDPVPAVGRDLGVSVEVVEGDELTCQGSGVRG